MSEEIHIRGLSPADVSLLKSVADEAADKAVQKTFMVMGLDPSRPLEAQADMQWLRSTRERCQGAEGKAILTSIGLLVAGAATTLWVGFKGILK